MDVLGQQAVHSTGGSSTRTIGSRYGVLEALYPVDLVCGGGPKRGILAQAFTPSPIYIYIYTRSRLEQGCPIFFPWSFFRRGTLPQKKLVPGHCCKAYVVYKTRRHSPPPAPAGPTRSFKKKKYKTAGWDPGSAARSRCCRRAWRKAQESEPRKSGGVPPEEAEPHRKPRHPSLVTKNK